MELGNVPLTKFEEENFLPMFFNQLIPHLLVFSFLMLVTSLRIQAAPTGSEATSADSLGCPNPPTAMATAVLGVACPGAGTAILGTAAQGTTIAWFRDGTLLSTTTGATYYATQAGNYHNIVTDTTTGCHTYSNVVYLSQGYLPGVVDAIYGDLKPCYGQLTDYYVHPVPNTIYYQWTISPAGAATLVSGQGSPQIRLDAHQATFQLSLTPINECGVGNSQSRTVQFNTSSTCESLVLSGSKKQVQKWESVIFTNQSTITPREGASFRWNFGAGAFPSTTTEEGPQTVVYHSEGLKDIVLEYVDEQGQVLESVTYEAYLEVHEAPARKNKAQRELPVDVSLYPNPTTDWITVDFADHPTQVQVAVVTLQGQVVLQTEWAAPKREQLDLRFLPSGWYSVRLISESGQQTLKVYKR